MTADDANKQLDRVLAFFPRVEGKASFLFAVNVGMLAIAFGNLSYKDISTWFIVIPLICALFCSASAIYYVGFVVRPNTNGGKDSNLYFFAISVKSEAKYVTEFLGLTNQDLMDDLARQIHRNSEILTEKFKSVNKSLFWSTIGTVPWSIYLMISSVYASQIVRLS